MSTSVKLDVNLPINLLKPLNVPKLTLLCPGPAQCSPRVLEAAAKPVLTPLSVPLHQIMNDIKEGLKYVFQTKNELTLCISGTGHTAIEAVLDNILEPGSKILIPVNGYWCCEIVQLATRRGLDVIALEGDPNKSFSIKELEDAIQKHRPQLLFVVHGETSTGILQPVEELGTICHKYDCLLAVDSVGSAGAVPIFMDRWSIDILCAGSQKGFGCLPGLAPISFSQRAQNKIFNRKTPIPVYYWDMRILGRHWNCFKDQKLTYHHTIPSNLIYAFRECLAEICEETLEKWWQRHLTCSKIFQDGVKKIGWKMFVPNETDRLTTVITICVPEGIDMMTLIKHMIDNYSFEVIGGIYHQARNILRVGILGYSAQPETVQRLVEIINESTIYMRNLSSSK